MAPNDTNPAPRPTAAAHLPCSFFTMSSNDTNSMTCPSFTSSTPDPSPQNPNPHPCGDSPPQLVPSHPLPFVPTWAANPTAAARLPCSFFGMSPNDTNPANRPSFSSSTPDPSLQKPIPQPGGDSPPQLVPSHPLSFMPTRAANPTPPYRLPLAPFRTVNPRSSQRFLPPYHPSLSPLDLTLGIHRRLSNSSFLSFQPANPDTSRLISSSFESSWIASLETSRRLSYVAVQVAKAEPPQAFLPSSSHLPRMPSRATYESLLLSSSCNTHSVLVPNNPTIHSRHFLQSQAANPATWPADSPQVLKRRRISGVSETQRKASQGLEMPGRLMKEAESAEAARISCPGLEIRNQPARIAQRIPNSGSTSETQNDSDDNHASNIMKSSSPTVDDLLSVAKALGGEMLLDLVLSSYTSYISSNHEEEGRREPSDQSVNSNDEN